MNENGFEKKYSILSTKKDKIKKQNSHQPSNRINIELQNKIESRMTDNKIFNSKNNKQELKYKIDNLSPKNVSYEEANTENQKERKSQNNYKKESKDIFINGNI